MATYRSKSRTPHDPCAVHQPVPYAAPCPCSSVGERVIGNDEVSSSILLSGTTHRKTEMITPMQSKMARAAIGMGLRELAKAAGVSTNTVIRFERGEDLLPRTLSAIQAVLEGSGITFIPGGCYVSET